MCVCVVCVRVRGEGVEGRVRECKWMGEEEERERVREGGDSL